jgi:uncharacterized membrane protein
MIIILSYFDLRRIALLLQSTFLVANAALTLVSLKLGFAWYGHGYLFASIITFALTLYVAAQIIERLPYQAFISTNTSVR